MTHRKSPKIGLVSEVSAPKKSQPSLEVAAWMRKHPNILHHYRDIAKELDMEPTHVNAALARANARHPELGILREGPAGHYIFRPNLAKHEVEAPPPKVTELYERVGVRNDKTVVVRDEDGKLFVLVEL